MMLPWHQKQWQWFLHAKEVQRLPHALLLSGIPGMGKAQFADHLTHALLCQKNNSSEMFCDAQTNKKKNDRCHACHLIQTRAHPNVLWIEPEKTGQAIKIDQIREITDFINQSALLNGYRIIIIHTADDMNLNAANALLKTLEEPPPHSLLILVSHQAARLPRTILSRCQRIIFEKPKSEDVLPWLEKQISHPSLSAELLLNLTNGAPLAALELTHNGMLAIRETLFEQLYALKQNKTGPIQSASQIQEAPILFLLDSILSWLIDLLRLQMDSSEIINIDYMNKLLEVKQQTTFKNNLKILEQVQTLRTQICSGFNLNKQLMLETIFFNWMTCKISMGDSTCF